jgi:hypothetical protein
MNRFDRWLLALAYVLLITLTVVGGWWAQDQFEESHDERCTLAKAELILIGIQSLALRAASPDEFKDEITAALRTAAADVEDICGLNNPAVSAVIEGSTVPP